MECIDVSIMARTAVSVNLSSRRKVLISINTAWNFVNFRSGLIKAIIANGYEVVAAAPIDGKYVPQLEALGCRFIDLPIESHGTNICREIVLFWHFCRIFISEQPQIYLAYTAKPNIYGSIVAHLMGISVVNNIAGLGSGLARNRFMTLLLKCLYWVALRPSTKVFFQNNDDRKLFLSLGIVRESTSDLLPGSGVDLSRFTFDESDSKNLVYGLNIELSNNLKSELAIQKNKKFRFTLIARMLWDKGIGEFVAASKLISIESHSVEFCLLGFLDSKNHGAISRGQMDIFEAQGIIYLGASDDVRLEIARSDCIVLPSYYREGTPRILLEAAAMGKPIITTDAVGCREVVDDGINGYLCKIRDAADLAKKMDAMLHLSSEERWKMGLAGRRKMERQFDEKIVVDKYLKALVELIH
jgi:glycosyltransferase involved in cell wall biosynthesis